MTESSRSVLRRVRILGAVGALISLTFSLLIWIGLDDGGLYLVTITTLTGLLVAAWPYRPVVIAAVTMNTLVVIGGLMTAGILYGFSLAALIHALGLLNHERARATASATG